MWFRLALYQRSRGSITHFVFVFSYVFHGLFQKYDFLAWENISKNGHPRHGHPRHGQPRHGHPRQHVKKFQQSQKHTLFVYFINCFSWRSFLDSEMFSSDFVCIFMCFTSAFVFCKIFRVKMFKQTIASLMEQVTHCGFFVNIIRKFSKQLKPGRRHAENMNVSFKSGQNRL